MRFAYSRRKRGQLVREKNDLLRKEKEQRKQQESELKAKKGDTTKAKEEKKPEPGTEITTVLAVLSTECGQYSLAAQYVSTLSHVQVHVVAVGTVTLDKFYGSGSDAAVAEKHEKEDLATVVKRRRILAARAAEERHVRAREERMRLVSAASNLKGKSHLGVSKIH